MNAFYGVLVIVAISGLRCGQERASSPESLSSAALVLQIHLPSALSRTEKRREAFLRRVSRLELEWNTRSGKTQSAQYPPGQWDQIALPDLGFPAFDQDALSVRIKVWDTTREGAPRLVPALSGRAVLKAAETAKQGPTQLHLRLSLHVPVSDYD